MAPTIRTPAGDAPADELSPQDRAALDRAFPPPALLSTRGEDAPQRAIALAARQLAEQLYRICPNSRERSVALTQLETAVFWAVASITRGS